MINERERREEERVKRRIRKKVELEEYKRRKEKQLVKEGK